MFIEGMEYSRSKDIHDVFGGQRQGGISTPKDSPYVFIFTGKSGEQHGYEDGWQDEGVFLYTGEGQKGDMQFKAGNAHIRDHDLNGRELLLFEALGKSRPVRFIGRFACQSWDTFRGPDTEGTERECIRFHLVRLTADASTSQDEPDEVAEERPIEDLRKAAREAAKPKQSVNWREARVAYRKRSAAVRDYVLVRADGKCELTGKPAPFLTPAGRPYLEVHHTRRLSDDGPDDPRYVAAICPTVHREIHFGAHGEELNQRLIEKLAEIEPY
ncbi:hypothetical protein [Roseovarius sp.]|uniref:hypothetical protein n=1 Tax=Roseovarius sp. TaxID=1486281 RepID=UPI003A96DA28